MAPFSDALLIKRLCVASGGQTRIHIARVYAYVCVYARVFLREANATEESFRSR